MNRCSSFALWQTGRHLTRECAAQGRNWEGGMKARIHSPHPPENALLCKNIMRTLGSGFAWPDGAAREALERIDGEMLRVSQPI